MSLEQFPHEAHYTLREERLNSLSHGLGALMSVVGTALLVSKAAALGDIWKIVSFSIFGASLILLYSASTFYHASRSPRAREIWKMLDHCAIFLLIAGTYTPFVLVNLRGPTGWTLFGIVWGLALAGIILKLLFGHRYKILRVLVYLAMGWLILFAAGELNTQVGPLGVKLTVAGGIVYTAGVVFYLADKLPYNHAIWHLFTVGGSLCHFLAIYYAVLPYGL
ncbi:hemolysin III family protein [Alcanivorax sp. 1008]|uniref:PAQR family membrane homeostasis protein TrhA n=1 Tax=Alcanivorax sp. 1008 TaxID=2816853 RepID=UPI001DD1F2C3|nr:hemolysin III family protein [Alcanivorax sp. 1008]MCC1496030.1 hemolysin III family protein [Alcanivorax sp. 1008]